MAQSTSSLSSGQGRAERAGRGRRRRRTPVTPTPLVGRTGAADALTSIFRSTRDSTTERAWYAQLSPRRHPRRQAPPREGQDPGAARADAGTRPETEDARTVLKADALGARSRAAESDPGREAARGPRSTLPRSPGPGSRRGSSSRPPRAGERAGRGQQRPAKAALRGLRAGEASGAPHRWGMVLHRPGRPPQPPSWPAATAAPLNPDTGLGIPSWASALWGQPPEAVLLGLLSN